MKTGTSKIQVFVDGVPSGTPDTSISATGSLSNTGVLYLADQDTENNATANAEELHGDLDEVKIYRAALTPDQILTEYNRGKATVMGSTGTTSTGAADNSAARVYCVPGDTTTCTPPVFHASFDENTGTVVNNIVGTTSAGTATNTSWTPGKVGQAFSFNGTSSRVAFADNAVLDFDGSVDITLEAWVYLTANTGDYRSIFVKGNANYYLDVTPAGNVGGYRGGNTGLLSNTVLNLNQWYHVVYVLDDQGGGSVDDAYLYINGVLDNSNINFNANGSNQNDGELDIGVYFDNTNYIEWWPGKLDDIKIYNYARTPAQVAWDYNRGGPVAWWRMDECQGTTAHDASGNSLHGILTPGGSGQTAVGDCATNANTMWYNGRNGKFNASLNFDGTNDYVEVSDPGTGSALDFDTGSAISISAWMYPLTLTSEGNYRTILTKGWTSSDNGNYLLEIGRRSGNDVIAFCYKRLSSTASCYYTNTDVVEINAWQHITVTYTFGTGSSMRIYKDGQLLSGNWESGDGDTAPTLNNDALWIGGDSFTWIDGQVDDVRIYRYALTPYQIRDVMNQGAVAFR